MMNVTYAKCQIFVQGIEMNCPLCKAAVASGVVHSCSKGEKPKLGNRNGGKPCIDCGDGPCYMNCGPAVEGKGK